MSREKKTLAKQKLDKQNKYIISVNFIELN